MKLSEKYEKLMEFIYDQYRESDTFQGYGEYANTIVTKFQRETGIRFGNVYAQMDAMRHLYNQGWIEIVQNNDRNLPAGSLYASRIKPANKGILHVEERRSPGKIILKGASSTAEIIGRFFKGFSGR